jgi:hypothetical protein
MQIMQTDTNTEVSPSSTQLIPGSVRSARPSTRLIPMALPALLLLAPRRRPLRPSYRQSQSPRFIPQRLYRSCCPPRPLARPLGRLHRHPL